MDARSAPLHIRDGESWSPAGGITRPGAELVCDASLNFFRSLGSAFIVAAMGAILLAGLGATPGRGSASVVAISMSAAGVDVAIVFRYVFLSALIFLALSLVFLLMDDGGAAAALDHGRAAAGGVAFFTGWPFLTAYRYPV